MLNTYDIGFIKTHEPERLEIHYCSQSFEGEALDIEKLAMDDGDLFKIVRDGTEITACKIKWSEE
jgi:hypothetical protein